MDKGRDIFRLLAGKFRRSNKWTRHPNLVAKEGGSDSDSVIERSYGGRESQSSSHECDRERQRAMMP